MKAPLFGIYYRNRLAWFSFFGLGLLFKDSRVHRAYYSERNGYVKTWRIGWLTIGVL